MKELHLVIVSPESLVYEGKVSQATFPGSAGKFQVMADHAPLISTLSAGEVKYVAGQETQSLQIKGDSWKSRRIRFQSVWNSERSEAGDEPNMFLAAFRMKNRTILCFC